MDNVYLNGDGRFSPPKFHKPNILYIDDDKTNLLLFKETFKHLYKITTATSGPAGLEIFKRYQESIDIVISDLRMPEMSGIDFFLKLIEINPEPIRILLTAYSDIHDISEALTRCRISHFVQKPWDEIELIEIINDSLKKHYAFLNNKHLTIALKEKTISLEKELLEKDKILQELQETKDISLLNEKRYVDFIRHSQEGIYRYELAPAMPLDLNFEEQVEWILEKSVLTDCNDSFSRMYGFDHSNQLLGNNMKAIWGKSISSNTFVVELFIKNNYTFPAVETKEVTKNGQLIWFLNNGYGRIENNCLEYLWGTQIDITQKKHAEEALIQSEQKFRLIAQNTDDVIWTLNDKGCFTYVSPSVFKLRGYTPDEVLTQSIKEAYTKHSREKFEDVIKSLSNEDLHQFENRVTLEQPAKNGGTVWTEVTINKILDSKNQLQFYLGVSRNITKRLQTEQKLKLSEAKFSKIFRSSPDAIILTKLNDGKIVDGNNKACVLTGYSIEELVGNSIIELGIWSNMEDRELYITELLKSERILDFEAGLRSKNGEIKTCLFSGERIDLTDGSYILAIIRDISERKKMENALKESEKLFKSIIKETEDGIVLVDNKNNMVLANKAMEKISGYSINDLKATEVSALFDPLFQDEVRNEINENRSISKELSLVNESNNRLYVEIKGKPIQIGDKSLYLLVISNIHQRYLANKALRKSESKLRTAQKLAHLGHWSFNFSTQKADWSDEIYNIYDLSKKENSPDVEKLDAFVHPEDKEWVMAKFKEAIEGEHNFNFTYRILTQKGTIKYIKQTGRIISDHNNNPLQLLGVIQDVTDIKLAEAEIKNLNRELEHKIKIRTSKLRASEKRFRHLLLFLPDGIAVINKTKQITLVNRSICQMLGYSESEMIRKPLDFIIADNSIKDSRIFVNINQNNKPNPDHVYELSAIKKNGKRLPIDFRSRMVILEDEINIICIIRDISKRKENEANLRKLTQVVEQSPSQIAIADMQGNLEYVNPSFCEVSQYSDEELIGKNPRILQAKGTHNIDYKKLWETILGGNKWEGDLPNKRKNGEFYWARAVIFPVFDSQDKITDFVSIQNDITNLKQGEEELKLAKKQAESANVAKSAFLANISHEIRTPLNSVLGMSEILHQQISNQLHLNYLNTIISGGKTLLSLINDILDLSRMEAGKFEIRYAYFNLKATVQDIYNLLEYKAKEKGLSLKINYLAEVPKLVYLDELRFRQILINIINNAIKFTLKGEVNVDISSLHKGKTSRQKAEIIIKVIDSGIGMKKESLDNIFSPFTQIEGEENRKFGGSGLGLTISKRLIELLNGDINVVSHINKGSVFTIHFHNVKCSYTKTAVSKNLAESKRKIQFKDSLVLIVDDNEDNRLYLKAALRKSRLKVIEAVNGVPALKVAKSELPDLIITDILMPKMDGHEFIKRLKSDKELQHIPIIATSASLLKEHRDKLLDAGVKDFISKPIQLNQLYDKIALFIPIKEQKQDESTSGSLDITKYFIKTPELKKMLQEDIYQLWLKLQNKQAMRQVSEFSNILLNTAAKYSVSELEEYGKRINRAVEAFDIDQILKQLAEFPKLIGKR